MVDEMIHVKRANVASIMNSKQNKNKKAEQQFTIGYETHKNRSQLESITI
jgi:hypothetical protein